MQAIKRGYGYVSVLSSLHSAPRDICVCCARDQGWMCAYVCIVHAIKRGYEWVYVTVISLNSPIDSYLCMYVC